MKSMFLYLKKVVVLLLCAFVVASFTSLDAMKTYGASKIKLNKTSAFVVKGKSIQLRVKGTKAKVKWFSKSKKIAVVNRYGKVKGKSIGTVYIIAKVKGKKLKCFVRVGDKRMANARKLRSYILKKGKKSKGGWKSISLWYGSDDGDDESSFSRESVISAKKGTNTIKFFYENFYEDNAMKVTTTVTYKFNYTRYKNPVKVLYVDDDYGYDDEGFDAQGTINKGYDVDGSGVGLNKLIIRKKDDHDNIVVQELDPNSPDATLYKTSYLKDIKLSFSKWNHHLKKKGYSMRSIGFYRYL